MTDYGVADQPDRRGPFGKELLTAFTNYDLCLSNPNIMKDIRRLHRFSIINPLAEKFVVLNGTNTYQSEPADLVGELDVAAFQIIIYGELFASSMQAFLKSEKKLLPSFKFTEDYP